VELVDWPSPDDPHWRLRPRDTLDRIKLWSQISHFACELFGHRSFTHDTMERLTHWLEAEHGAAQGLDVQRSEVVALLQDAVIRNKPREKGVSRQQKELPPAEPEWTPADTLSRWAKLFGFSVDTLKRRFKDGLIRHKKLSTKSYQIAVDDVPAPHQTKFRNVRNPPPK
jgi:hypothetical protein